MIYFSKGAIDASFSDEEIRASVFESLGKLPKAEKILIIPPDFTRYHSMAGKITSYIWEYYVGNQIVILPALGTHSPMTCGERTVMFGELPPEIFHVHNWKNDVITLGEVPLKFVREVSEGKVDYAWPAQVNRLIAEGNFNLVISVGQVVPHEVVGMANYNKNIFIGTGGKEGINKSHFLGAAYGMERMMGRIDTPVRKVLNYASDHFTGNLPLVYFHTVIGKDAGGNLQMKVLYVGNDKACFETAA